MKFLDQREKTVSQLHEELNSKAILTNINFRWGMVNQKAVEPK